jgi:hypothetical protein
MITKALWFGAGVAIVVAVAAHAPPAQAQGNIEAEMIGFHQLCDRGDKRACIRFGILIGENRQRHASRLVVVGTAVRLRNPILARPLGRSADSFAMMR